MSENKVHSSGWLLCLGYGYCAQALADGLDPGAWRVTATVHRQAPYLAGRPVATVPFEEAGAAIVDATHILISAPPGPQGDPVLALHAKHFAGLTGLRWLGYLSTTGVYGDTGGRAVDETAALRPNAERSKRRILAEESWRTLAAKHGLPLHIFRLAGIYGPGRNPLDQVRAGTARRVRKPGHLFSRIHVDDIVQALIRSMTSPRPGAIYNLSDDEAADQADVIAYACSLLGIEPPPIVPFDEAEPTMSAMQRSFWDDNRRIDNTKMKAELGVRLIYPNYRDGLRALVNDPKDRQP